MDPSDTCLLRTDRSRDSENWGFAPTSACQCLMLSSHMESHLLGIQVFSADFPVLSWQTCSTWVRHTQMPTFTIKRRGWDGRRASGMQGRKLVSRRHRSDRSESRKIAQKKETVVIAKYLPGIMKRRGGDGDYRKSELPMTWHSSQVMNKHPLHQIWSVWTTRKDSEGLMRSHNKWFQKGTIWFL